MFTLPRRFVLTLFVPLFLLATGTLGFHLLEGLPFFEALYLSVITLTTIGYGDIAPRTAEGRAFTMFLVLGGVFGLFYAAMEVIRSVVSGEMANLLGKRQMERALAHLHNHIIVCGYGRMGRLVCREFSQNQVPFVLIDARAELLKDFHMPHGMALVGDATSDEVLRLAGVERARGLVTVMDSDANNLFTTMSARLLNPLVFIVARVEDMGSEQKLIRAGANRVVSPYHIGGTRVAQAVLRPTVMDFIELATRTEHIELQLEETRIGPHSVLAGVSLKDSRIRSELKIIVLTIKKDAGKMVFNPDPDTVLQSGDILVAIGNRDQLQRLETLAQSSSARPPVV